MHDHIVMNPIPSLLVCLVLSRSPNQLIKRGLLFQEIPAAIDSRRGFLGFVWRGLMRGDVAAVGRLKLGAARCEIADLASKGRRRKRETRSPLEKLLKGSSPRPLMRSETYLQVSIAWMLAGLAK